jgi:hypothetical protein
VLRCCWRQEEPLLGRILSITRTYSHVDNTAPTGNISRALASALALGLFPAYGVQLLSALCRADLFHRPAASIRVRQCCAQSWSLRSSGSGWDEGADSGRDDETTECVSSSCGLIPVVAGICAGNGQFRDRFSQFRQQFARLSGRLASIDKTPEDVLLLENRQFGFGKREEIEDRLIVGAHRP